MENMVMEVVTTLAVAIITGAVTVAVAFLQSKIKSEKINLALGRLETATNATVAALQQEVVEDWKKAGGGKLTAEQANTLRISACIRIKKLLDDPATQLLVSVGVELDGLIQAMVEKAVIELRGYAAIEFAEEIGLSLPERSITIDVEPKYM